MRLLITSKDLAVVFIAATSVLAAAVLGWRLPGEAWLIPGLVVSVVAVLLVVLEVYRRLNDHIRNTDRTAEQQRRQDYRQIESLFSLFFTLKPDLPWPDTRGWAASPDLLKKIMDVILSRRPELVVEASSGVSTLVIAYCLKKLGRGRVISFEHEARFAEITRDVIAFHGMDDIATIVHAPLANVELKNHTYLWYDPERLAIPQPIDLLVIDGPPGGIQKLSRYPALPLLYRHLNKGATIILDDGHRIDEREAVALWEKEFAGLSAEFLDAEKGAFVIHKT